MTEDKTKMNTEDQNNKDSNEVTEKSVAVETPEVTAAVEQAPVNTETETPAYTEKEVNSLLTTFFVEVSKEDIENDFNEALVKYAAEIKLPGFRQGKIPLEVMRSRFKDAITDEVVNKIVEKAVFQKIDNDNLKIISRPEVMKIDYEQGQDLKAEVRVELFPTVTLPDFETLEVEIPADQLKREPFDEQKQIDAILEGNRRQSPVVSREVRDGDYVMYDLQTKILDTKKMSPRSKAHFHVNTTEKSDILDLYQDVLGKKIDESFTITRTYPADYQKKVWAGKTVEHYIKIASIFEMVKPEFNQEFLKTIGFEDETTFKNQLKEEYEKYNTKYVDDAKLRHIIEKISDIVQFPVPEAMIKDEMSRMLSQMPLPQMDATDRDKMMTQIKAYQVLAERNIRFTFIMEAIKEEHKLDVTTEELEKEYKNIAEHNNLPVKDVRKYYLQKENAQKLREVLMKGKVMDFLKEKVKTKEV